MTRAAQVLEQAWSWLTRQLLLGEVVVNLDEAKSRPPRSWEPAAAGEEIIIAKAGHRRRRSCHSSPVKRRREPGGWEGKVWVADVWA